MSSASVCVCVAKRGTNSVRVRRRGQIKDTRPAITSLSHRPGVGSDGPAVCRAAGAPFAAGAHRRVPARTGDRVAMVEVGRTRPPPRRRASVERIPPAASVIRIRRRAASKSVGLERHSCQRVSGWKRRNRHNYPTALRVFC